VITVERLDDGEVSPHLVDELRVGDEFVEANGVTCVDLRGLAALDPA
jgi:hypothetical protein